ncbi:protein of unknown function [Methylorubrum extorquens DM4]|uniref:Uncharacterized protein n=1 Tax=Methylorubrum extorquens (strain DSM 6343 / CIP 106787 / DM4) TaxID=661410 RepID=C7CCD9_METED|nr:hypothetical protein [Methylorubrum extorquens]CAX22485.1 protein of unknown function [Methylorubrum extorquens DM4]
MVLTPKYTPQPRPFGGLYLEVASKLDSACPGYLNRVLYASALKRSIQFAAYPEIDFSQPEQMAARLRALAPDACCPSLDPVAQIARGLLALYPRDIARAVFGSVPEGFLGVLGRIGDDPLPEPADYRLAFNLFFDPANKARAKLLRQKTGQVSAKYLRISMLLAPVLVHQKVFERIRSAEMAETLNMALDLIRQLHPTVTDEALHASLDGLSPKDHDLSDWVGTWLSKAEAVPMTSPFPADDPDLKLISPTQLADLGRRFKNCAASYASYLALGTHLVFEWTRPGQSAVIVLRSLSDGRWLIEQVRSESNGVPDRETLLAIRAKLHSHGILRYGGAGRAEITKRLAHFLRLYGLEGHGDLLDEGLPDPFEDLLGVLPDAA